MNAEPSRRGSGSRIRNRAGLIVAVWLLASTALGLLGLDVEDRLQPSSLAIEGSESARGDALQRRTFGNSAPIVVLLLGPEAALERQGPRLVAALRRQGQVRTISPWDRGVNLEGLRPRPNAALILADFARSEAAATDVVVPETEELVSRLTRPPVESHLSGYAVVGGALEEASIAATRQAELIAVPILIVILLVVFRSPIAAAVPLLVGGATLVAARGLIELLTHAVDVDALAVSVASMMGLALGVDYTLLLVSRFREQLAAGQGSDQAATATAATAGRTIVFAGAVLAAAMITAAVTAPGALLTSVAAAVVVVVVISVVIALLAGPALLRLLGRNIDRWLLARRSPRGRLQGLLRRVLGEPVVATIVVLGLLLILAGPALALETGPPNVRQLPAGSKARQDFEALERIAGPGWSAPFVVIAAAEEGPVTQGRRLHHAERWQERVARDQAVEAVIGPGELSRRTAPLTRASQRFARTERQLARGRRGLNRLAAGLERATSGVAKLRQGLLRAAAGAGELGGGARRASRGAKRLLAGLERAAAGADRAVFALSRLRSGSERLAAGAERIESGIARAQAAVEEEAVPGAERLAGGLERGSRQLERLRRPATITERQLGIAFRELEQMTVGKADPHYLPALEAVGRAIAAASGRDPITGAPVRPGYRGLDAALAEAVARLRRAARGAARLAQGGRRLAHGLGRLEVGAERLADGAERLADGGQRLLAGARRLDGGLERLADGTQRLARGLERLDSGSGELASGLAAGYRRSQPLEAGLGRAGDRLPQYQAQLSSYQHDLDRLDSRAPKLFDSGYFVLAALDGAPPSQRRQASEAVNVGEGGSAARFLVIPKVAANTPEADALGDRLTRAADQLGDDFGGKAAVTGGAAQLADYDRITSARLPLLVLALSVITYLLLIPILRALLLPLIAVLLNLFTVAAAFGVLTFLFQLLPGEPLGGPGYTDAVSAAGIFGIVFGLSIDYEVFLLSRMREGYLSSGGDGEAAIAHGLERTAAVITGAAAIMTGVFLAFASVDISTIRQFGIGLSVAVILDATVVRLVLLPALMRLCGPWTWWLPSWLDRLLPNLDVEPDESGTAARGSPA